MNRRSIMRYKLTNVLTISVKQPLPYLRDKGDFYHQGATKTNFWQAFQENCLFLLDKKCVQAVAEKNICIELDGNLSKQRTLERRQAYIFNIHKYIDVFKFPENLFWSPGSALGARFIVLGLDLSVEVISIAHFISMKKR